MNDEHIPFRCTYHADIYRPFFFQAEDGIRDSVASRGLGDVYKRQLDNDTDRLQYIVLKCLGR